MALAHSKDPARKKKDKNLEKTHNRENSLAEQQHLLTGSACTTSGQRGAGKLSDRAFFPTTEWTTRYYRTCVTSYTTTTTPSPRPCRGAGPGNGDGTLRPCFAHVGPVPFFV